MGKMTILHLIENLNPGGAQTRLYNDLKFLNREKFDNVVCSMFGGSEVPALISGLGCKVYDLGMKGPLDIIGLRRITGIIKIHNVRIIHTQLFFSDIIGRVIGRLCGIRHIVSTVQCSAYEPDNKFLYSRKRRIIDSFTGRLFNERFIAVSDFVRDSIIKRLKFDADKIAVINNYVDTRRLEDVRENDINGLRAALNLKGKIVFVVVGRLNSAKGQRYILRAMPGVIARHKDIRLLIIGDGPDMNELKKTCRELSLGGHVEFLGERNDVRELLHLSDIFILLTESEGLCLAVLEAMAVGKPCIISDIGPNKEIVDHMRSGILVDPKKHEDVCRAMNLLIEDAELRKALGDAARSVVMEKFSHNNNVNELEKLYEGLLS